MSEFAYNFIHSLRMREKAYFKRYAQLQSNSAKKNYLRLYEALEQQEYYDKNQLLKRFEGEPLSRHFSSEANYLAEQLLNSLTNFHFETSNSRKLIKLILQIDLLTERGFRKKAQKVLNKAKKMADKFEEFSIKLKLIQLEEELLFKHGILHFTQQLQVLQEERSQITQKIQNLNELRLLREQIRELQFSAGFVRQPEKFPHLFANPILDEEQHALSLNAKENWHYIQCLRHYLLLDFRAAKIANHTYFLFFKQHASFFKQKKLLPVLSNLLYFSALDKDQELFAVALSELQQLETEKEVDQHYVKYIKYARILELYYQTNDSTNTRVILTEAQPFTKNHHHELGGTERDYLVRLIIRAHIQAQQWEEAQDWINFWYKVKEANHAINILKLFSLIIYCELDYRHLLASERISSTKLLQKLKQYGPLEKQFLQFFKKWNKIPTAELGDQLILLEELIADLEDLEVQNIQQMPLVFFNFKAWATQKRDRIEQQLHRKS